MLLFINGVHKECGVYQYGLRLYKQLEIPDKIDYAEIGSKGEYDRIVQSKDYSACILNYHGTVFPWWSPTMKTYYIYHEFHFPYDTSTLLDTDPTKSNGIPRPISQCIVPSSTPSIPTFGSFGFGFATKGFEKIVTIVQNQYDIAIIRLLIPSSYYGDPQCEKARDVIKTCRNLIRKPGIRVLALHDFVSDEELVAFLASNTLNIFLYDHLPGRGCSSVMDFAVAAKKPIAISDSDMFRHVYSDSICAYKRPLQDIIADGDRHILPLLEKWNPTTLRNAILDRVGDSL